MSLNVFVLLMAGSPEEKKMGLFYFFFYFLLEKISLLENEELGGKCCKLFICECMIF